MTREEFEQMALDTDVDNRASVFKLRIYKSIHEEYDFPETTNEIILYFMSREEAVDRMKMYANGDRIICFQIEQQPLGVELEGFYSRSALWLFDKSGELIDRTYASSILKPNLRYPEFWGRPRQSIRFKPGDIVEFITGYEYHRGIVFFTPTSTEDVWQRVLAYQEATGTDEVPMFFDFSDDYYIILDEDYREWGDDYTVWPINVLPLSTPVSEETRQRLIAKYQWASEGN